MKNKTLIILSPAVKGRVFISGLENKKFSAIKKPKHVFGFFINASDLVN